MGNNQSHPQAPGDQFSKGASELFESEKYSDITIVCGKRNWHLHKSTLCTQSAFFAKACDGGFEEAEEARIDLGEDGEGAVRAMLHFFYHGDYIAASFTSDSLHALMLHAKLYIMGDKYFNKTLCDLALKKLAQEAQVTWWTDAFADAVEYVYASTSGEEHELRMAVVKASKERMSRLFSRGNHYAKFKEMAWATPDFAADVVRAVVIEKG